MHRFAMGITKGASSTAEAADDGSPFRHVEMEIPAGEKRSGLLTATDKRHGCVRRPVDRGALSAVTDFNAV